MPRTVVLDELHLTFRIPAALLERQVRSIRRVLNSKRFPAALRRAAIEVMTKYPTLKPLKLNVSR